MTHFGDIVQLEQDGLVRHYEALHASTVPNRRALIEIGANLNDSYNPFLGHYRSLDSTTFPLSVRSVCQHYLAKYSD